MGHLPIIWTSNWHDDLIWCPSQLYRSFHTDKGELTLYCRWRHSDPWTYDVYSKPGEFWLDIGEGLSQRDLISRVHKYAESLLVNNIDWIMNQWIKY